MPRSHLVEFRRKVLDLIEAGRPVAEIADQISVSGQTIYNRHKQDLVDRELDGLGDHAAAEHIEHDRGVNLALPVGAHNSVVGADQGFRAPSWDQESVRDSGHEDLASAPIAAGQRPRQSFRHPYASFKQLVKRLRHAMADRSLEEIEQLSGVNRSSLSRLLRGESWGTLPVIARLEQALGEDLWGDEHR